MASLLKKLSMPMYSSIFQFKQEPSKGNKDSYNSQKLDDPYSFFNDNISPQSSPRNTLDDHDEKELNHKKGVQKPKSLTTKDSFSMVELLPYLDTQKSKQETDEPEIFLLIKNTIKKKDTEPKKKKKVRTENDASVTNQIKITEIPKEKSTKRTRKISSQEIKTERKLEPESLEGKAPITLEDHPPTTTSTETTPNLTATNSGYYHLLFANPANLFYKKMGNERHYYISQIANGSAGIFLEKPDWKSKTTPSTSTLSRPRSTKKARISSSSSTLTKSTYRASIPSLSMNSSPINLNPRTPSPRDLESSIQEIQTEFEDYVSKNVYGKKATLLQNPQCRRTPKTPHDTQELQYQGPYPQNFPKSLPTSFVRAIFQRP